MGYVWTDVNSVVELKKHYEELSLQSGLATSF